ncbi:MAG TPA: RNA ligase family protein [Polyangia bacterium]|nr:RNA ligase family protein [Polyangia bacterium]
MSASTKHVPWGSIELLHNLVATLGHLNGLGQPFPVVEYRAKVKLHGTNCAVQINDGGVFAQSRTALLSAQADYKGFAAWVFANRDYFAGRASGMVVFGEWCGPGVEKGMAISQAKTKLFVVFAVRRDDGTIVHQPEQIRALLPAANAPAELHVLPWEGSPITIAFGDRARLEEIAAKLNARVAVVEREDPWAKSALGISGLGEGLVFYPVSVDGAAPPTERFEQLMFKAKGEKHRTAGTRTAVQVDPSVVASVQDFVALMLTEARLRQGLTEACGGARDPRWTRPFLEWVAADVRKESGAELAASGLTWGDVDKAVQTRAREWFRLPEAAS